MPFDARKERTFFFVIWQDSAAVSGPDADSRTWKENPTRILASNYYCCSRCGTTCRVAPYRSCVCRTTLRHTSQTTKRLNRVVACISDVYPQLVANSAEVEAVFFKRRPGFVNTCFCYIRAHRLFFMHEIRRNLTTGSQALLKLSFV